LSLGQCILRQTTLAEGNAITVAPTMSATRDEYQRRSARGRSVIVDRSASMSSLAKRARSHWQVREDARSAFLAEPLAQEGRARAGLIYQSGRELDQVDRSLRRARRRRLGQQALEPISRPKRDKELLESVLEGRGRVERVLVLPEGERAGQRGQSNGLATG
jgi:hypothetical protein